MKKQLTEGPEWKRILLFALPIMAGQFLQQLYNTVDGIVVGNFVSEGALAAVGSCGTLSMVFIALAMGMSNGCGIVIAQLFGAKEHGEMRRAVSTSLIMLFALGVAATALGILSTQMIMDRILSITDPEINRQAVVYFRIYSLGLIFQFLYNAAAGILRSVGDSAATLYFLLVSTVANIIGDLLLVAAIPMGVAGAALATVLAQAACAAVSFIYMYRRYEAFRFTRRELVFDRRKFVLCLKMGIPTSVQQLVVSCGNLLLQRLVNSFGPVTMAACTVGSRFDHYIAVPVQGFFTAMSAFAGQNTGAGKPERIQRGVRAAVLMDVGLVLILAMLTYTFAAPLARLFGVEGETLSQSVEYLRFVSFCCLVFAVYLPINGTFHGCGEPLYSMAAAILTLSGKVAGAYVMAGFFHVGYSACWKSCIIGWILGATFVLVHFFRGKWKNKSLINKVTEDV